ncbi:MAG TPA: DUF642 domain-containing protein [Cellvibrionaceae bacterium]|nr:DUF642 domain-containing protein [Cellvibrionaceae bacterium]HMW72760.1 DUF642 domain-containing protein [Cellvibrionaceae bacterium]HNG60683.1 DUF642 domain-containing protein [Cellvibrionaceae bacterium]
MNIHKAATRTKTLVALGALVFSSSAFCAPNLITNGSFEEPALPAGSDYLIAPVGSAFIPGWSVVGIEGKDVVIVDSAFDLPDGSGVHFWAAGGSQWIDLTGAGANTFEGVAQTLNLDPGLYSLGFSVGNIVTNIALGKQSTVSLWINGAQVSTFTNSAGNSTDVTWQPFTYTFTAAGLTTLEFYNGDSKRDTLSGLDEVFLTAITPVPEPSAASLILAGLALMGFCCGKRRV